MVLLGGPAGGAFALCLGSDGHLAIEAVGAGHDHDYGQARDHDHDHGPAAGVSDGHHLASADCIDIPLVQASPLIVKKQLQSDPDVALPGSWPVPAEPSPAGRLPAAASPAEGPALDPRLVAHRTVVLLN